MKYATAVFAVVTAVLLLVSGVITASNVEMSRLMTAAGRELTQLRSKASEYQEELKRVKIQNQTTAHTLSRAQTERDELKLQLDEALLSVQEACAREQELTDENKRHVAELSILTADYQALSIACMELENELTDQKEENARAAAAYAQQTAQDAEKIAQLEAEKVHAPEATPFVPIRYRMPIN